MDDSSPVDVLLVEDDLADVLMVREALDGWRIPTELHVASDGVEATAFLRQQGQHAGAPRPAFVLLDLNMPRMDGFEVLTEIKNDEELCVIPIIVFSTSQAPEHVRRSYHSRANAYVVKPAGYEEFARVVQDIDNFYTRIVARAPLPRPRTG
jgi:CheY-like chemotaxis protein